MPQVFLNNIPKISNTYRESLRGIRTNLMFSGNNKVLLFTSAIPNDGKSTVTFEVASAFAKNGKRVLIIDTDIRKSVLASRLQAKMSEEEFGIVGLSHLLSRQASLNDVIYTTNIERLDIVFAGVSVPNATEILDSTDFKTLLSFVKNKYDYIFVDSAPVTAAIDSTLIAKECDGVVLIVDPNKNNSRVINRCIKQLEVSGTKIIGVILNKVEMKKNTYYGKYYGSYYGKYYGRDEKNEKSI